MGLLKNTFFETHSSLCREGINYKLGNLNLVFSIKYLDFQMKSKIVINRR
jgi:hypothetical protein